MSNCFILSIPIAIRASAASQRISKTSSCSALINEEIDLGSAILANAFAASQRTCCWLDASAWIKEGTGGTGIALYDAPTHYFTGISGNNNTNTNMMFQIYPNPCNSVLNISFELKSPDKVKISIYLQTLHTAFPRGTLRVKQESNNKKYLHSDSKLIVIIIIK